MISTAALPRAPRSPIETGLIITAIAALLFGTAVCLSDRDWVSAMFLEPFVDYQWSRSTVFGALGGCLPYKHTTTLFTLQPSLGDRYFPAFPVRRVCYQATANSNSSTQRQQPENP